MYVNVRLNCSNISVTELEQLCESDSANKLQGLVKLRTLINKLINGTPGKVTVGVGNASVTPDMTGGTTITASNIVPNREYKIVSFGNTDFSGIGPASALASTIVTGGEYKILSFGDTDFLAIGGAVTNDGFLTLGQTYQITTVGTSTWMDAGASANVLGTVFVATGVGSAIPGNGNVIRLGSEFTASGDGAGTGTVFAKAVGTEFVATAVGSGTGTVREIITYDLT